MPALSRVPLPADEAWIRGVVSVCCEHLVSAEASPFVTVLSLKLLNVMAAARGVDGGKLMRSATLPRSARTGQRFGRLVSHRQTGFFTKDSLEG